MAHRNARLTPHARHQLLLLRAQGWTIRRIAGTFGISEQTVAKWLRRYREGGAAALADRSSRPHRCPRQTPPAVAARVCVLRQRQRVGPHRIAAALGLAASTVYTILRRHGLQRLRQLDGQPPVPQRYEYRQPGELVHLDVKKLGRIPDGGGWRVLGRPAGRRTRQRHRGPRGYDFLHVAVDDHSRYAYVEALQDEQAATTVAFLERALVAFAAAGISVQRLLTDNGGNYRAHAFRAAAERHGLRHRFTRPYHPQTNGKAEAFIKTLQREWAYAASYATNEERLQHLQPFLTQYNQARPHSALGHRPPVSRLNNVLGNNS